MLRHQKLTVMLLCMATHGPSIRTLRLEQIARLDPRIPLNVRGQLLRMLNDDIDHMSRNDARSITQQGLVSLYPDPDTQQYYVIAGIGTWTIASRCLPPKTKITARYLPDPPDEETLIQHITNEIRFLTASPRKNEAGCLALIGLAENGLIDMRTDSAIAPVIGVTRQTAKAKRKLWREQQQKTESQEGELGLIELNG